MTALTRLIFGLVLLAVPDPVLRFIAGRPATSRVRAAARILGLRELVQAAVTGFKPDAACLVAGAETDSIHAATMLAVAVFDSRSRRLVLGSAATASLFAAVGVVRARRAPAVSPGLAHTGHLVGTLIDLRHQAAATVIRRTLPGSLLSEFELDPAAPVQLSPVSVNNSA